MIYSGERELGQEDDWDPLYKLLWIQTDQYWGESGYDYQDYNETLHYYIES